jgi:predicted NodU family carbamoyl transferase
MFMSLYQNAQQNYDIKTETYFYKCAKFKCLGMSVQKSKYKIMCLSMYAHVCVFGEGSDMLASLVICG